MKKSVWIAMLCAMLLALGIVATASAHATLDHAEPAPGTAIKPSPPVIKMWFTEDLEPSNSWAKVIDTSGTQVDKGNYQVSKTDTKEMDLPLPPLADGLYNVVYQTQSATDGHVLNGSFDFTVGDKPLGDTTGREIVALMQATNIDAFPSWGQVLARAFNLLTLCLLVGSVLFPVLMLMPAARYTKNPDSVIRNGIGYLRALVTGKDSVAKAETRLATTDEVDGALAIWSGHWESWLRVFLVLYAIATVGILVMQATLGNGTLADIPRTLLQTRFGMIWFVRVASIIALAVVVERANWTWTHAARPPRAWWLAMALGLVMLLTQSETSHSASAEEILSFALLTDFIHVGGTAIWLGGLAQLILTVPAFVRAMPRPEQPRVLGGVVACFSLTAFLTVGAIILSGIYALWLHVGTVDAFFATLYGTSLFVKFVLILPLLALAALNLIVERPTLAYAVLDRAQRAMPRLNIAVAAEIVLIALILVAVGVLTSVAPAATAFASAPALLTQTGKADDLTVTLGVSPGALGTNDFGVQVVDANGNPVTGAQVVRFYGTMQDMQMGTQQADGTDQGDGFYTTRGDLLSMIGNWQLRVLVRRAGKYDTNVTFAPFTALPANVPAVLIPPPLWTRSEVQIGLLLTLAAFAVGTVMVLLNRFKPRVMYAALGACIVIAVAGAFLVSSSVAAAPKPYVYKIPYAPDSARFLRDPLPVTAANAAAGGVTYQQHCAVCHGVDGKGDGPAAKNLYPPPVDLSVHAGLHPEGNLYYWITNGIEGSAMPAWNTTLTDEQRWQLVQYIRSLAPRAGFTPSP